MIGTGRGFPEDKGVGEQAQRSLERYDSLGLRSVICRRSLS
jgi:hypothetical protein